MGMRMRVGLLIVSLALAVGAVQAAEGPDRPQPLPASLPLSLSQAQARALAHNHDLAIARSTLAAATANVLMAAAAPNPVLGWSTSSIDVGGHNGSGSLWRKRVDSIVSLSQLIERGDKREWRRESAQHKARAVDADLRDVRRQLRLMVAQSYADLHAAQDRLAAARDSAQLMDALLTAAQLRRSAGDIAGADVERVKVDALRARNDVTGAQAELQRARRVLALLLAGDDGTDADRLEAVDSWPSLDEAGPRLAQSTAGLIERRADVIAAVARIAEASAGTRLAESLRTRDVLVGVQYEHFPQSGDSGQSAGNSIGVSLQVPLFTRYYYEGEIGASLAALDSARQSLARVRAVAEAEVSTARSALQSAVERVRRNRDELLVAAERSAAAADYAYRHGAVGVIDMLDARRTLRATRQDAFTALADFSKALASWRAATEPAESNTGDLNADAAPVADTDTHATHPIDVSR